MQPIIFIVGPTATGKTEIAYLLAQRLKGEIISCDSMLIYKEPRIITSKPAEYILEEIKHHFIGIISVTDNYNVFDYYKAAAAKIRELIDKSVVPIVCGGSGLYMKVLCDGIFEGVSEDKKLREKLQECAKAKGLQALYDELKKVDPQAAAKISANDLKRIVRALEVYYTTGTPISQKQKEIKGLCGEFAVRIFGLDLERQNLYERINKRTDVMFAQGAVNEVRNLLRLPLSLTARKIIGIYEISRYLEGQISEEQARELMKKNTRNFAKRQFTWFRADKRIEWIDIGGRSSEEVSSIILRKVEAYRVS